jgi:hypothetical protein
MNRSGAFLNFFCRRITFKDRLRVRAKCAGSITCWLVPWIYDTTVPDAHRTRSYSLFNKYTCAQVIAKLINIAPLLFPELEL